MFSAFRKRKSDLAFSATADLPWYILCFRG